MTTQWDGPNIVDNDFGAEFPSGDYMDTSPAGNHAQQNKQAVDDLRGGLSGKATEYAQQGMQNNGMGNTGSDPDLMANIPGLAQSQDLTLVPVGATPQLSKAAGQAQGFNTRQARSDFTMGVIASASNSGLENSRVYVETPNTKIAGTVLAVGDQEFAVMWDDRTASVERKGDYELVVKN